jgi:hypothetical protein
MLAKVGIRSIMREAVLDEMVQVLIPKQYVVEVYRFVADLVGGEKVANVGTSVVEADDDQVRWLDAKLAKRAWDDSSTAMRTILRYLGEHKDEWVSIADVAQQLAPNADAHTVAGTLGAFTRRSKSRYGQFRWPFEWKLAENGSGSMYMMPARFAVMFEGLE